MDDERERWRHFGAWLEGKLLERYPSKEAFARASGVAFHTINDLVNGGRATPGDGWRVPNPFDSTLVKLATALGLPERELVDRVGGTYKQRNPDKSRPPRPDADRLGQLEERMRHVEEQMEALGGSNVEPIESRRRRRSPG